MDRKNVLWTTLTLPLVLPFPLSLIDQWKVRYVLYTPLVLLVHPITFVPKGLMDSKVCLMDSFNTAFSPAFLSLPFVTKGLMESKVFPIHSFNAFFSPACPSHHFCP